MLVLVSWRWVVVPAQPADGAEVPRRRRWPGASPAVAGEWGDGRGKERKEEEGSSQYYSQRAFYLMRVALERPVVKFVYLQGSILSTSFLACTDFVGVRSCIHVPLALYPPSDGDLSEFIRDLNPRESSETHLGLSLQKDFDSIQV